MSRSSGPIQYRWEKTETYPPMCNPPFTLVIDLDGTILDIRQRHYACYKSILESHGVRPVDQKTYWDLKRQGIKLEQLLAISDALLILDIFLNNWFKKIESTNMLYLDKIHPGAFDVLNRWRRKGIHLVLATMRQDRDSLENQLDSMGLNRVFDDIVLSSHTEGGSGKAKAVKQILNDDAQDPDCGMWIGDTEADVQAARWLAWKICVVTCGIRSGKYLNTFNPDFSYANVAEIPENIIENW